MMFLRIDDLKKSVLRAFAEPLNRRNCRPREIICSLLFPIFFFSFSFARFVFMNEAVPGEEEEENHIDAGLNYSNKAQRWIDFDFFLSALLTHTKKQRY